MQRKIKGFSLIELVVVIGIITITSGTVLINFGRYSAERSQLYENAQILVSHIRYAQQMTTQGYQTEVRLNISNSNRFEIWSMRPNIHGNYVLTKIENHIFSDGIHIASTNVSGGRIRFTNRGSLSDPSSTTRLHSQNYRVSITTTIGGGRVYIHEMERLR